MPPNPLRTTGKPISRLNPEVGREGGRVESEMAQRRQGAAAFHHDATS